MVVFFVGYLQINTMPALKIKSGPFFGPKSNNFQDMKRKKMNSIWWRLTRF